MIIKLLVSLYLLLSHSICLRDCKICVVFVETKPESNPPKLRKVLSPPQLSFCELVLVRFLLISKDFFDVISFCPTAWDSHGTNIWFLVWLFCALLPLLSIRQLSFHNLHSEYVFQMSPEENYYWKALFITSYDWRSKDKLISDVFLWIPTYGRSNVNDQ